ncbi:Polyketide synthase [Purpureocillium lavendulum]|uniref:Polyketide synthase n=1 Tax=Purpureocillium lavendulum TaxID=1247861 RepID=A0AB34FUH1_9HYPO|nr:Polyketide synthase [Purpureocillium lavendulum]
MAAQSDTPGLSHPGPKILLFGSLALSFDAAAFAELRKTVIENNDNSWLAEVISDLPQQQEVTSSALSSLKSPSSRAREQLQGLSDAFATGGPLKTAFPLPNALLIPLIVAVHLTQYTASLRQSTIGHDSRVDIWSSGKRNMETVGLCTGLLSAFAVSSAHNGDEFRRYGAAAVRLGMLIGLAIDGQEQEPGTGRHKSLSVAWTSGDGFANMTNILREHPKAYVSVYYDGNRATVTAPSTSSFSLSQSLRAAGLAVYELGLYGRFHSADNADMADQLAYFCDSHPSFQLPDAASLAIPTRASDSAGVLLLRGPLHAHALRSILLEPPRWFDVFSAVIKDRAENVHISSFGPERSIPPSLASKGSLRVTHLADHARATKGDRRRDRPVMDNDIAVVGMSCKVAGADNLDEFWDLLVAGKSQHRDISTGSRFSFQDTPFRTSDDPNMRRKWFANLIDGHDQFDHRFFKKSARESATMDPQQRQILQVAYRAVEQSGYLRSADAERDAKVGCFVGVCLGDYENNVACHAANAFTATGNLQGFIAGKVSHFFGWTGPGLTIDTACSSSLVAVHQACSSILSGECNAALAGGSHIMTSAGWFQNLAAGSFLSPTGPCKPFDAKGDGYCRGEGVGAVFLKKMSQAMADGDQILGVIAATAVQQNQSCTPIFVPNVPSLSDLFTTVVAKARVKPSQISVVEAHGTGTPVGDPAEYGSIRQVLGGANRAPGKPLMLSSVKGLVGHMECTSGIISLIKILLMINKGVLPPQASFDTISPSLNASPADQIFIPTSPQPWDSDFRIALINNYGASGSNASMVVMQPPQHPAGKDQRVLATPTGLKHPFWLTALDDKSLRRNVQAFRRFLAQPNLDASLANVSFNQAQQSNRSLDQSLIFTASSMDELQLHLSKFDRGDSNTTSKSRSSSGTAAKPAVVLCFGGQVSTYVGLDRQLYSSVAVLRKHLHDVDTVARLLGAGSIFPGIFQRSPISDIVELQVALFALQYACARSWIDSGIQPAALVGHSFGELTALCVSQTLSLEDTVKLIINRATLVRDNWGPDRGAMMAIEGDLKDVEDLLTIANGNHADKPASIACYNGPRSFTVAGSTSSIDAVAARLEALPGKTFKSKRLNVTNAFHSALVDPLLDRLEQSAKGLTFREPVIHIERATDLATTTGLSARFVADHLRNPVYFHHAIERLARQYSSTPCAFIEAGSNSTITVMASRALAGSDVNSSHCSFHSVSLTNCDDGWNKLADTTMSLWRASVDVQYWAHHPSQRHSQADIQVLLLPPYQFDPGARHWFELKTTPKALVDVSSADDAHKAVEKAKEPEGILSFIEFLDGAAKAQARFRVNTTIDEYKKLLSGHLTAQTAPICPATVQMGFVIDAISSIRPEYREAREPQIEQVAYQSPVCANSGRTTWIEVKNENHGDGAWRFEVFSTENHGQDHTRMVHTTGRVVFLDATESTLERELVRFERLFSHRRALDLLQSTDADEMLANRSIYRIFAEIVDYGDEFRGLHKLVSRGDESAGHVIRKTSHRDEAPLFDAHLADTFCQLGGLWINCMTDRSPGDLYLANGIDKWIRRPSKTGGNRAAAKEFHAFATHHRPSDRLSLSDVFVFDASDGTLVEVILGIAYVKIPKLSMEKLLLRLSEPAAVARSAVLPSAAPVTSTKPPGNKDSLSLTTTSQTSQAKAEQIMPLAEPQQPASNRQALRDDVVSRVKAIIADLSGLEVDEIGDDSELADLGIDSLAGMEMVNEIETTLKITLPQDEILSVTDMPGLVNCVAGAMGISTAGNPITETKTPDDSDSDVPSTPSSDVILTNLTTPAPESDIDKDENQPLGSRDMQLFTDTVMEAFNETKNLTDSRVVEFGQTHYVSESLPLQNELAVALTLEVFEALGAGIRNAQPGQKLARIPHGKEHEHFVTFLYQTLETETQVIKLDGRVITRTHMPLPQRSSRDLHEDMLARFPDQRGADELTYYAGVNLARVLSGETDGVKLIFGSPKGRDLVSSFYADWPLNAVLYAQMEDFLTRLTARLQSNNSISESKPLRILEMGAGTGGTTKRLLPLLARLQVPVEYTFTDLAPSFVASARKSWGKQYPFMKFRAHDIEKPPAEDLIGTQHLIIASNAIHATRSLRESTRNVRKALRNDGFLLMLEMTRTPFWVDLIFGLFEGWWLFDDGRRHALTHESRWQTDLQAVGYGHVDWTDGERPESEIERLILAAASSSSRKATSAESAAREQIVAQYVRDLTQGFEESIDQDTRPLSPTSVAANTTMPGSLSKCILITGASGGLGAHLVAEAAIRPDVARVICLNRRNRQDARERQEHALRKKGIELPPHAMAKIEVVETDLSHAKLGLPDDTYRSLLNSVTHIVHNAWMMHSKWPVKRFEPQLRIMAHMLGLARDISLARPSESLVSFLFVSSIATVGHHPLWTGKPFVPEERVPIDSVLPTGYGDAKYICERMLDATLHRYPSRFRATAVRLGQIAGSRANGHWNPMEHVSFLIKSAQTLGALPALPGTMGWTPGDDVAGTIVDIVTQPDGVMLHPIYHVENPIRQPWSDTLAVLADALDIPKDKTGILPLDQWVQRVRDWPRREDNGPEGANPAYLLVDFLYDNFLRMSCGGLLMGTARAREHSPTLARLEPVTENLILMFIRSWQEMGFLA